MSFPHDYVPDIPPCHKCGKKCDGTERFWVARDLSEAECDRCHVFAVPGVPGFAQE